MARSVRRVLADTHTDRFSVAAGSDSRQDYEDHHGVNGRSTPKRQATCHNARQGIVNPAAHQGCTSAGIFGGLGLVDQGSARLDVATVDALLAAGEYSIKKSDIRVNPPF